MKTITAAGTMGYDVEDHLHVIDFGEATVMTVTNITTHTMTLSVPSTPIHLKTGKKRAQWKMEKKRYGKK